MKLRKIVTMGLAAIMAVSAMSISAFAEMVPGFVYNQETGEAVYCEKDSSELPGFDDVEVDSMLRHTPQFSFSLANVPTYPRYSVIPNSVVPSGGENIYIKFNSVTNYRIRLFNETKNQYATDWSSSMTDGEGYFFSGFPVNSYKIYLASNANRAVNMSGVVYTAFSEN